MTKIYTFEALRNHLKQYDDMTPVFLNSCEAIQLFSDCRDRGYITEIKYLNVMKNVYGAEKGGRIKTSLLGLPVIIDIDLNPKKLNDFLIAGGKSAAIDFVKLYRCGEKNA